MLICALDRLFFHIGKCYSAIEKFCTVINMAHFSSTTFLICLDKLNVAQAIALKNIFTEIHKEVQFAYGF